MNTKKAKLNAERCEYCQPHYPCDNACFIDFRSNLKKVPETPLPPIKRSLVYKAKEKLSNINPFQKLVYFLITTIATALGINLAGIRQLLEMEFTELTIVQFAIYVIGLVGMFALGLLKTGPGIKSKLNVLVEYLSEELIKATDEASDAGQKITKAEILSIVEGAVKAVFK
jgi:hypothetical protein